MIQCVSVSYWPEIHTAIVSSPHTPSPRQFVVGGMGCGDLHPCQSSRLLLDLSSHVIVFASIGRCLPVVKRLLLLLARAAYSLIHCCSLFSLIPVFLVLATVVFGVALIVVRYLEGSPFGFVELLFIEPAGRRVQCLIFCYI